MMNSSHYSFLNPPDYFDLPPVKEHLCSLSSEEEKFQERIKNSELELGVIISIFEEFSKDELAAFDKYRGQTIDDDDDEVNATFRITSHFSFLKAHLNMDLKQKETLEKRFPYLLEDHDFYVILGKRFVAMLKENYPEEWSLFMENSL